MKWLAVILFATGFSFHITTNPIYLRGNQVGYLPNELKIAVAFSRHSTERRQFEVVDVASGQRVWGPAQVGANAGVWENFAYHYRLDFSGFNKIGRFK